MVALYRCAACGSPHVKTDVQISGIKYNYLKGAVGTAVIGAGGAVAGIENKETHVFKCPDCGTTLTYPMDAATCSTINMCVASLACRNNLTVNGIKFPWSFYTDKYKNIEKGYADMQLSECRDKYSALLKSKATASKKEFDQAISDLDEYCWALGGWRFRGGEIVPKAVYEKGKKALVVFIENLYVYIPPAAFTSFAKYNDKPFYLRTIWDRLFDYLLFWHMETFGYPMMHAENWSESPIQQNDFAKAFVYMYTENRDLTGLNWKHEEDSSIYFGYTSSRTGMALPSGAFWEVPPNEKMNESFRKIFRPCAYPAVVYAKSKTYTYSWRTGSDGNKEGASFQNIVDIYFKNNPEKKSEFDALMKKRDDEMMQLEKAKEDLAKFHTERNNYIAQKKSSIESNKAKIQNMELEISKQERKIFGKAKAQATVERLRKEIQQLKDQNAQYQALIQSKEKEKPNSIPTIQDKNAFSLSVCSKMEFFYPQMFDVEKSQKG